MKNEKEVLLEDIEKIIAYGKEESTINPALLAYFEVEELQTMKKNLLERVGVLSQADREWLEQFKKYD